MGGTGIIPQALLDCKHCSVANVMGRRNFSSFHDKLNVNDATNLIPAEYKPADQVAMWKD